jgi:hypothetical protein
MASTILGQQAVTMPADTTGNRPTASAGMIRYNTTTGLYECYDSLGSWRSLYTILYTHHFEDATRNITLSTGSSDIVGLSWSFTKQYANSYLIVRGMLPVSGQYSYQAGEYLEIAGTRKYTGAHYVSPPDSMGDDGIYSYLALNGIWTNINSTGSKTVNIGYAPTSGGTGERPGTYWNPENRGGRARSRTTVIDIFEVDSSIIDVIT